MQTNKSRIHPSPRFWVEVDHYRTQDQTLYFSFVPSVFAGQGRAMRRALVLGLVLSLARESAAQTNPAIVCVNGLPGQDAALGVAGGDCTNRTLLLRSVLEACAGNSLQLSCLRLPGQAFSVILSGCSQNNASLVALREALQRYTQFDAGNQLR